MKFSPLYLAVALVVAAGCSRSSGTPSAAPGSSSGDAARLQGRWKPVEVMMSGQAMPEAERKKAEVVFHGDRMTLSSGGRVEAVSSFTLDSSKSPKEIDFTQLDPGGKSDDRNLLPADDIPEAKKATDEAPDDVPNEAPDVRPAAKPVITRGIYSLEGDTLKICFPGLPDKPRPTAFAAPKGSATTLLILQRDK